MAPTGAPPIRNAVASIVDYPPPPAAVEQIGADPGAPCMWVDGYWSWQGRRWVWTEGGWFIAPEGCYFSRPTLQWQAGEPTDVLYYAPPRWYPENADELDGSEVDAACRDVKACRLASEKRR
jgi:hypothetical protein